jgi:hypothetical protein
MIHVQPFKKSANDYSYGEIRDNLQGAVKERYGTSSKDRNYYYDYPYIRDVYPKDFVVEYQGKFYIAEYKITETGCEIGSFYLAKPVKPKKVGNSPVKSFGNKPSSEGIKEAPSGKY